MALCVSGCSMFKTVGEHVGASTRKITRKITGAGQHHKKKMAVAVFANQTAFSNDIFSRVFQPVLKTELTEACSRVLFICPDDPQYPDFLTRLPLMPSGAVDHFSLAKQARKQGINAVVVGHLTSVKTTQTLKGFIWFKETHPLVRVDMSVSVYDAETGSKLLDERFDASVEIDEDEMASIEDLKTADSPGIHQAFKQTAEAIAETVCDQIDEQPWKGFVVAVSGDKVILSSGEDTGLVAGDILEVFNSGSVIEGAGRQKYFLPGLKTGEIKITKIFPRRSEAVIISGDDIKADSSVKPR